ncbi:MAG: hypothetical protein ACWGPS_03375 [Candidatus Promineifilaceae bacterium]
MSEQNERHQHLPAIYQIRVSGRISRHRIVWFDDLAITISDEDKDHVTTTLTGTMTDQAALLGVLQKLYNLGLTLLLVKRETGGL